MKSHVEFLKIKMICASEALTMVNHTVDASRRTVSAPLTAVNYTVDVGHRFKNIKKKKELWRKHVYCVIYNS